MMRALVCCAALLLVAARYPQPKTYVYGLGFQGGSNVVYTFEADGSPPLEPTGELTGFLSVQALYVDAHGNLDVLENGMVEAFHPGATTPFITLQTLSGPQARGLCGTKDGTLYVMQRSGKLAVIAPGRQFPSELLTDVNLPALAQGVACAGDELGNVYLSYWYPDYSGSTVWAIDRINVSTKQSTTIVGPIYYYLNGLLVSPTGTLFFYEDFYGLGHTAPPYRHVEYAFNSCFQSMRFARGGKAVWGAACGSDAQGVEYTYPGGDMINYTDPAYAIWQVAVSPSDVPRL